MRTIEQFSKAILTAGARLLLVCVLTIVCCAVSHAASVNLVWDANTESNLAGYNVYRSTQSGVAGTSPINGTTLVRTASYTDATATAGNFYYVVRAVLSDGTESPSSNELQVAVIANVPALVAPASLAAQCSANSFTVDWTAVAGADFYYVRVDNSANNVNGSWFITDGVDFNLDAYPQTSFSGKVVAGQAYSWWVHAGTAAGLIGPAASGSFTCGTANTAPTVNAGADRTITLPAGTTLSGTATDDGKPNSSLSYAWSVISGSGVTLSASNAATTTATFAAAGSYTLRLTVSDGALSTSDDVVVTVNPVANTAPTVDAGADRAITLPAGTTLSGTATDDGKPNASLSYAWSVVAGSGVTLSAPNAAATSVTFADAGSYTLRLTVSDGALSASDDVVVTVNPQPMVAPTGLTTQCAADGKMFTVKWNAASGAASYYLRVDYLANNVAPAWFMNDGKDYNQDAYTQTSFTAPAVPGQQYNWWVHSASATGEIGPVASGTFNCKNTTIDSTAPTVSISAPLTGSTVTANSLTLSAAASDNVGVAGVQFRVNGASVDVEDTTAPYSISVNIKKWTNGTYVLEAVARDAAGNLKTSAPVSINVNRRTSSNIVMSPSLAAGSNFETAPLSVGYAEMDSATAGDDLALITYRSGGDIVSETSVTASAPVDSGRIFVTVTERVNTGLALANNGSEAAVVSFYFTNKAGEDFGAGKFTLEAQQNMTTFVNQAPFNLPMSMEGSLTFTSSHPIAVTALQGVTNERGEFLMTTLPVVALEMPSAQSLVMPQFADGGGWSSQVVLTNPTNMPLSGTVSFFSDAAGKGAGVPVNVTVDGKTDSKFSYTIAPRASVRFATSNAGADVRAGYVVVNAAANSVVPQGITMFSYSESGIMATQAGVRALPTSTASHTYVEVQPGVRSGMAIANTSSSAAQITLQLESEDAAAQSFSASFEVSAGGHVARFVDELMPQAPATFKGVLRVTSNVPVAMTGLRLRTNDHGRLIISGIPVVDDTATPAAGTQRVFPIIVFGGGYSTTFIGQPATQN
jgi:hypothetical protein